MCGIFCSISVGSNAHLKPSPTVSSLLQKRGPDQTACHSTTLSSGEIDLSVYLEATVLSLRGPDVVPQPLVDAEQKAALCWNGEAWKLGDKIVSGNDTQTVFEALIQSKRDIRDVEQVMHSITGPFAFCFLDELNCRLFFGRDPLGRRSLLMKTTRDALIISSVGDGSEGWKEVEADGIYVLNLAGVNTVDVLNSEPADLGSFTGASMIRLPYSAYQRGDYINDSVPQANETPRMSEEAVDTIEALLLESLSLRLAGISFNSSEHTHQSTSNRDTSSSNGASPSETPASHAKIAILFSGGLDCTLLALLLHTLLPPSSPILLINVAFQNPRTHSALPLDTACESCPDRITARRSLAALLSACPTRPFTLHPLNIPYPTYLAHRPTILTLMAPHSTQMDLSIASALYFAASPPSAPRVLLSGLGADELFAGYARHAAAARRGALAAELRADLARLPSRNLGRDDRVIAHAGREARYPFLDERLVAWACAAPVWEKCGLASGEHEGGEAGKLVLRRLAARRGLEGVAREPKRAIQFGARSAKMEDGKSKGTDVVVP